MFLSPSFCWGVTQDLPSVNGEGGGPLGTRRNGLKLVGEVHLGEEQHKLHVCLILCLLVTAK